MPAYILRYEEDMSLAGFYAANGPFHLSELLDQEYDPGDFVYAELPDGFGIQFYKGEYTVRYELHGSRDPGKVLAEADRINMTSELIEALAGEGDLVWRAL